MSQAYDIVVIGAGPGGYIAAIRAAQLGFSVACVEFWRNPEGEPALGGTCLNVGCIPSKALLASSEAYERIAHQYAAHGIAVDGARIDVEKMQVRKQGIVRKMTKGIEFLFRKNKVTWLKGRGRFIGFEDDAYRIEIADDNGDGADKAQLVEAKNVVIATGSKPRQLPGVEVDNRIICDNVGALAMPDVPKRLGVVGAGVIGLELGSVWRRLGAEVTMLEALPTFLGAADEGVRKEAWKRFTEQGLRIELDARIASVESGRKGLKVRYSVGEEARTLECDRLIVSVGRVPNTDGLGLDAIDLALDERGFIPVDDHCRTALPNLWAIGDVVRGPMLAHKAEDEGVMVAERIAGQQTHIDYGCIPWVIYTSPEVAWVGRTEDQLKAEGRAYKAGQFPFSANGRALGTGDSSGFVKVLADAATDEVLGVHVVSGSASELIAEATLAMEFRASAEDIGRVSHPHPSMSEALREAALAATDKRALNM